MVDRYARPSPTLPSVPLLITEDKDDFAEIQKDIHREIKPRSAIERIYVEEMAALRWESLRLRRCKTAIINKAFRPAMAALLTRLLSGPGADPIRCDDGALELTERWFTDAAAKKQVAELLRRFGLDESAIEAEAITHSATELVQVDRLLASAEARYTKALRLIGEYRAVLAPQLCEVAGRITVTNGKLLQLENRSSKRSSTA